jgi:hypothetical protein
VGEPPEGTGLRLGHDLLATLAGLERARRLARLHEALLAELNAASRLDWSRCVVASRPGHVGSKHHLITDVHGTPLAVLLTGGSRNHVTQLMPLLDAIPSVRGGVGRPRRKPDSLFAERGYDHDIYRDQVRSRGIVPAIAAAAPSTAPG